MDINIVYVICGKGPLKEYLTNKKFDNVEVVKEKLISNERR